MTFLEFTHLFCDDFFVIIENLKSNFFIKKKPSLLPKF